MDDFLDTLKEQLEELPEHWNDPYWWADHWMLQVVAMGVLAGSLELGVHYLKLSLTRSMMGLDG
jgi:hypothetical protein